MSIVGAQGVSMSELTGMGLDRLNAMAQGQQPSIAPSYLVLAAIEQLKKGKAGEQAPMPQGTVKDRLLASINQPTPTQAGIGQMAPATQAAPPTQHMSGGGSVRHFDGGGTTGSYLGRSQGANLLPDTTGYEGMSITDFLKSIGGSAVDKAKALGEWFSSADTSMKDAVRGTTPTNKTYAFKDAAGAGRGIINPTQVVPDTSINPTTTPNADPTNVAGGIGVSSRSRGVGGLGTTPLATYATLGPAKQASDFKLDIPNNAQLTAAAAKFSAPDAARMAELKGAEDRAGLGAFARGMVNTDRGRGFGAVFGSAVADANDAKEKRADARREYEDRREQLGMQLGISLGDEAKQKYLAESKWGAERAQEANKLAVDVLQAKNQTSHFQNEDINFQERNRLQYLAHVLQAEIRKDGLNEANFSRILRVQQQALEAANKAAETQHGKVDPATGQALNPTQGLNIERTREKVYRDLFPEELEATMNAYVTNGMNRRSGATPVTPVPAVGFRGRMGG
jgi:hypothetical protein